MRRPRIPRSILLGAIALTMGLLAAWTLNAHVRERVASIIGCEEAKGREALAQHFAFKTSMSVDDARAALAASPAAAPSKPDNAFAAAMNSTENPNVGAGGAGEDAQMSVSERLLAAHSAATGIKYDKK